MNYYIGITTAFLFALSFAWSNNTWLNRLLKMGMTALAIWGLILFLMNLGFIVKLP